MLRSFKNASTMIEYAVLIAVVMAAFLAVQPLVARSVMARLYSGTKALTSLSDNFHVGQFNTTFKKGDQYRPYYTAADEEVYQEQTKQQHVGKGHVDEEVLSDIRVTAAGSYTAEVGSIALWEERGKFWPESDDSGGGGLKQLP